MAGECRNVFPILAIILIGRAGIDEIDERVEGPEAALGVGDRGIGRIGFTGALVRPVDERALPSIGTGSLLTAVSTPAPCLNGALATNGIRQIGLGNERAIDQDHSVGNLGRARLQVREEALGTVMAARPSVLGPLRRRTGLAVSSMVGTLDQRRTGRVGKGQGFSLRI